MTDFEDDDSKIFPQRLMEILNDEQHAESISWLPHGKSFLVRSRSLFAERVMPRYFSRKAKFSSFTRKLNRWNFIRVSSGPETGSYYHEFFLRDKPHLVAQMFCKNARSKMAMAEPIQESVKESAAVAPLMAELAPSPVQRQQLVKPNHSHHQQQQQVFTLDIPLALLESLVKPASTEMYQQQQAQILGPSNAAAAVARPGLLLQQSQFANSLLERQIQILQQEQAKQMLHLLSSSSQDSKPAASPDADDQRLLQMQHIMQSNQQRTKGTPTNHRASAA